MMEKRLLQAAVALAGVVPVGAGAAGVIDPALVALGRDSHAVYLSGLLLGIGLAFWSLVPGIARHSRVFSVLAAIVVLGGLARLSLALRLGAWSPAVTLPLVMELGVTPALWLWQQRVARNRRGGLRG
jgi:hypothetical protein